MGVDTFLYTFMAFVALGSFISFLLRIRRGTSHGSAKFVPWPDKSVRSLEGAPDGLVLGLDKKGRFVILTREGHLLVVAPTGAGKSTGVIILSLLNWGGSMVVIDLKGELTQATSSVLQAKGYDVVRIDPSGLLDGRTDVRQVGINPLLEAESSRDPGEAVDGIGEEVVDPKLDKVSAFNSKARTLLKGLVAVAMHAREDRSLSWIHDILIEGYSEIEKLGDQIWPSKVERHLKPALAMLAETSPNDRRNVISRLLQCLSFLANPNAADTLRGSWSPKSLLDPGKPTAVFLTMRPEHLVSQAPLLRLIIGSVERAMLAAGEDRDRRLLLALDEAKSLGVLHLLTEGIGLYRGYGATFLLTFQDISQMDATYGEHIAESIRGNCNQLYASTNNLRTAKHIEEMGGDMTGRSFSGPGVVTRFFKRLISAGDVISMESERLIVFLRGHRPTTLSLIRPDLLKRTIRGLLRWHRRGRKGSLPGRRPRLRR